MPKPGDFAKDLVCSQKRRDRSGEFNRCGSHGGEATETRRRDAHDRARNRSRSLGPVTPFQFTDTTRGERAGRNAPPVAGARAAIHVASWRAPAALERSPLTGMGLQDLHGSAGLSVPRAPGGTSRRSRTPGPPETLSHAWTDLTPAKPVSTKRTEQSKDTHVGCLLGGRDMSTFGKQGAVDPSPAKRTFVRELHSFPISGGKDPSPHLRSYTLPPSVTQGHASVRTPCPSAANERSPGRGDPSPLRERCPFDMQFDGYGGRDREPWRPWRRRMKGCGDASPRASARPTVDLTSTPVASWAELAGSVGLSPGRGQRFQQGHQGGTLTGSGMGWKNDAPDARQGKAQVTAKSPCRASSLTGPGLVNTPQDIATGRAVAPFRPRDCLSTGSLLP